MEYQVTFEISPAGHFGVPQDGVTVLDGTVGGEYSGDTYHTATMKRVGYGSLPEYRAGEEAVDLTFSLGNSRVHIRDNFAFFETEATTYREAYDRAETGLHKFLQHLSLSHGVLFKYQPLMIESSEGNVYPIPMYTTMGTVTVYDLDRLRQNLLEADRCYYLSDQRLERALEYLTHALFLFEMRTQVATPLSGHYTMLVASVFLNLWKAASAVVGDRSKREDSDYKSRCIRLGFDEEFIKTKIDKIRKLRNDYDVAHYTLDDERIHEIEMNLGEAGAIVIEILRRYRQYLMTTIGGSPDPAKDVRSDRPS